MSRSTLLQHIECFSRRPHLQGGETQLTYHKHKNTHSKADKMRQQRNMFQMKEQDKISKEKLSEEETGNLPEKEFTVMIIKMIEEFERRVDAQRS